MAIYHCSIQVVGRSAGRSSVAAAAYRSGTKLTSMYDGVTSDYTKKSWIEFTEIRLPEQAPKEYLEREKLWNAVEMSEKSRDSQLAREVELALPIEMNLEQQIELVREYVDHNFVKAGMCADIAIHNPPLTDDRHRPINEEGKPTKNQDEMIFRNPHAHILLTVRPIDDNGKWESKSQKEYLCIRGNEEKGFTSEEFKIQKDNGWHKQFRYYTPENTKVWLDEMTANRLELKRVDRNPKCSQYGRKNPTVEYWNQKERVEEWRKSWEVICNDKLLEAGSEARIDSRSFETQGLETLPTVHMGPQAYNMEKRAIREVMEGKDETEVEHSDVAQVNQEVKSYNKLLARFHELQDTIKQKIDDLVETAKEIKNRIADKLASFSLKRIADDQDESRIQAVQKEIEKVQRLNEGSYEKIGQYKSSGKKELIYKEYAKIHSRDESLENTVKRYGFESMEDYQEYVQSRSVENQKVSYANVQQERVFLQELTEVLPREEVEKNNERELK